MKTNKTEIKTDAKRRELRLKVNPEFKHQQHYKTQKQNRFAQIESDQLKQILNEQKNRKERKQERKRIRKKENEEEREKGMKRMGENETQIGIVT